MAHELGGDVLAAGKREYGPATVTITDDDGLFAGHRPRPAGLDEPRRLDHPAAGRASSATAQTDSTPFAGLADAGRATCTGSSSTPRSSTRRAAATSCATSSSGSPAPRRRGRRPTSSTTTVAEIRERVDAHAARDRLGRPGHLRPVGRRRLGGRGGARPSGGRRSADLHLRRPRPDAQEGVGAPPGDLRARPRHAPGHGRRPRALPRPAGRRRGPRAEAARSSATSSSASSRRRPAQARPDRLPDPGHALPRRHRERRPRRRRPPRRSRPTTTSAACRPTCASS